MEKQRKLRCLYYSLCVAWDISQWFTSPALFIACIFVHLLVSYFHYGCMGSRLAMAQVISAKSG